MFVNVFDTWPLFLFGFQSPRTATGHRVTRRVCQHPDPQERQAVENEPLRSR